MSTTTFSHFHHSRAQLAEASELVVTGSPDLARVRLLAAADHALLALAEVGAAPADVAPVLRDLDDDTADYMHDPALSARLNAGLGEVQALIDAYVAHPGTSLRAPAQLPLYGGANGTLDARGAEAAARGLTRIAAAARGAFAR